TSVVVDILYAYSAKVASIGLILSPAVSAPHRFKGRINNHTNKLLLQRVRQRFSVGFLLLSITFCQL
ncbi:hypothetical protein, partial [Serratia marcescens]|uniref:hypothetical protein n=1 Tax=Serratia marcescens TaxID=615 RepID=UPI0034E2BAC0